MTNTYDTYVIAGGSGFLGQRITKQLLAAGKKVYILSRQPSKKIDTQLEYIQWDTTQKSMNGSIQEKNLAVILLAGAGVAEKRWTSKRKEEILSSRIDSTEALLQLIQNGALDAKYIAFASAIGYYGANKDVCLENTMAGDDFLANTCVAWEMASHGAAKLNIPYSIHRIGIILGAGGGAAAEFAKTAKFHLAGIPGNGKQLYSWIHIDDVAAQFIYATEKQLEGIYNATSPKITTVKNIICSLTKEIAGWYIPAFAPTFVLKLMLGEMSIEVLKSASVSSQKIINLGFKHSYADIESATKQIATEIKMPS